MKFKAGDKICHHSWPDLVYRIDQVKEGGHTGGWYHLTHLNGLNYGGLSEFDADREWRYALNGVEHMLELV